jgi:hypothetical protein
MRLKVFVNLCAKYIKNDIFIFDSEARKKEALTILNHVIYNHTKYDISNDVLEDPIVEFEAGVYIPNFDYPIIPIDVDGNPIVWEPSNDKYVIPGNGTHIFRGVGLSGEHYYIGYIKNLNAFRECHIKVDRYTDINYALYAFLCTMTRILDKDAAFDHIVEKYPIKPEYEVLSDHWMAFSKSKNVKEFELNQKKLYMKWMQCWITTHGKQPVSHMRVLRNSQDGKLIPST